MQTLKSLRDGARRRRAANPAKAKAISRLAYEIRKAREFADPALKAQREQKAYEWRQSHKEELATASMAYYDKLRSTPGGLAKSRQQQREAWWRWRQNPEHRLQVRANWRASRALRDGRIVRGPCEVGQGCAGRLEMHHDDYARALDIRWLCKAHHEAQHKA